MLLKKSDTNRQKRVKVSNDNKKKRHEFMSYAKPTDEIINRFKQKPYTKWES